MHPRPPRPVLLIAATNRPELLDDALRRPGRLDRSVALELPDTAGREAIDRAPDPLQERYIKEFNRLPDWEQAMIVAALERVAGLLNAGDIDASPVLDHGDIKR